MSKIASIGHEDDVQSIGTTYEILEKWIHVNYDSTVGEIYYTSE